ncbi:MAG TPA: hypothetical protein VMF53_14770 [Alphaproteobacteria bacterium]|nr:hypothetical protein [Alphaproteobacteria bacterium]
MGKRLRNAWRVASLTALLASAGCIDEPHPFQPEAKPLPPEVADYRSEAELIAVAPVAGLAEPLSTELARAMAQALETRDVPVKVEPGPDARALYRIAGRYRAGVIDWELDDAAGAAVARYDQRLPAGADPASPGLRLRLLDDASNAAAREMIKGLEGDAVEPRGGAGSVVDKSAGGRGVFVTGIEGAPAASGDVALRRAIETALKGAQVKVVEARTPDSLLLAAKVEVTPLDAATRHVKVVWRLTRPDGKELGQVSQENDVPSRLLSQIWSEISAAVAANAVGGIAALVADADQPVRGSAPLAAPQSAPLAMPQTMPESGPGTPLAPAERGAAPTVPQGG